MQIVIQPAGFNFLRHPTNGSAQLVATDQGGTAIHVTFPPGGWESFQEFVADPEGTMARHEARSQIVQPPGHLRPVPST